MRNSFNGKLAWQQFWHDRWEHNSNFPRMLDCIFTYKKQQCKAYSSQHISHVPALEKPKQKGYTNTSNCHRDLAPMTQTCYQKRLSENRRFLLSNLSQAKTLSNFDSALRKGHNRQALGQSHWCPVCLPRVQESVLCHHPAKPFLHEWISDKMQTVSDLVLQDCIYKKFSAAEAAQNPWRKFLKCWHKRDSDSKAMLAAGKTHCTKPAGNRKK